jgi:hypothetical protein
MSTAKNQSSVFKIPKSERRNTTQRVLKYIKQASYSSNRGSDGERPSRLELELEARYAEFEFGNLAECPGGDKLDWSGRCRREGELDRLLAENRVYVLPDESLDWIWSWCRREWEQDHLLAVYRARACPDESGGVDDWGDVNVHLFCSEGKLGWTLTH